MDQALKLIIVAIAQLGIIKLYFSIAAKYNIVDKPNQRSSHTELTLRGCGIIFPISLLLCFFFEGCQFPFLLAGPLILFGISLLDDIYTLKARQRMRAHLFGVALVLVELGFNQLTWWCWILDIVLVIGWLNTVNFMDGINGMTALYALSVLIPFAFLNCDLTLVDSSVYYCLGIGLVVFGGYNQLVVTIPWAP